MGLPFLFLPVTTASYDGVPPDKTNQASALINVARNIGGSMGVALAQTVLAQRQQFHQSRLIEHAAPSDLGYQQTIDAMTRYFQAQGSNASDAASQAVPGSARPCSNRSTSSPISTCSGRSRSLPC